MKKKFRKSDNSLQFLSVIVPAYKAESFIEKSLLAIKDTLDQTKYKYEIICVIDGATDKTKEKALKAVKKHPGQIKVIGYSNNLGKGHAVRFGIAQAKGDIIGFMDAGFDLNPKAIPLLLDHFIWYNADIIIGSKRHPASKVVYPWQRKIISFVYQIYVRILFGLNVKDTQVGMKFFRREVLEKVLPRLLVKAWAIDIEMLAVANYLGYKRIFEGPVELTNEFGGMSVLTSKGFIKTVCGMIWDTLAVYYRLTILHYYDDENKNNWIAPKYLKF